MAAVDVVDSYLEALPGEVRRLAHAEWGITVPADAAGGWPLDLGVRIADGLLRVQAYALEAHESYDPWGFLWLNRQSRLVRFGCTRSGDIWVHGELPVSSVSDELVDRLMGLVVEAVLIARDYAAGARGERAPEGEDGGWLKPR